MSLKKLGPKPTVRGNQGKRPVSDDEAIGLLDEILSQMKIMNLYLSLMTDTTFEDTE